MFAREGYTPNLRTRWGGLLLLLCQVALCACDKFKLMHLLLKSPRRTIRSVNIFLTFSIELSSDIKYAFC